MNWKTAYIFLFFLSLLPEFALGQLSLKSEIIPQVGDTLFMGENNNLLNTNYYSKNSTGAWNYSFFKIPYYVRAYFKSASAGKYARYFPTADMVLVKENDEEVYYRHRRDGLYMLGSIHRSSMTKTGFVVKTYFPEKLDIPASMEVGQRYKSKSEGIITIPKSVMNDTYSWLSSKVDSLKFVFSSEESWTISDWGNLILPQSMETAQQHISDTRQSFESFVKYSGDKTWTPYSFNPYLLYDDFKFEALVPLNKEIKFYSRDYKTPVAYVKFSEDEVISSTLQERNSYDTPILEMSKKDVQAYPNPSFGIITFDLLNYPKDYYTIEVKNVIGRVMLKKKIDRYDNSGLRVDLTGLRKGTYMYSLFDSKGQKICTKRLSIITP